VNTDEDSQGLDVALNARLSQLGPVQPNPTYSHSSTFQSSFSSPAEFRASSSNPAQTIYPTSASTQSSRPNPALSLLTARYRLAEEADQEFAGLGRKGALGRQFLDVFTIREMLVLRDEKGVEPAEIEKKLGLRNGVVGKLGRKGLFYVSQG
jgi:hypothetical protein